MDTWKAGAQRAAKICRAGSLLPLDLTVRLYGGTDKFEHRYTRPYTRHLQSRRWKKNRILEIGVGGFEEEGYQNARPGGSLRVWRDYFPRSAVVGLDVCEKEVDLGRRVGFVQGDQSVPDDLAMVLDLLGGPPDIVIDDGSHLVDDAERSFRYLFPLMSSGSLYVFEDLHTSYWREYGGGIPAPTGTAVGLVKTLVDAVQACDRTFDRKTKWGERPSTAYSDVIGLHVYPGICFIVKSA